jgi:hypothetical protein
MEVREGTEDSSGQDELMILVKRMQQQLMFLEKKIDTLIEGSQNRAPREKRFSRPFRPEGNSNFRGSSEGGNHSGNRNFGRSSRFDPSRGGHSQGFGHKKKRSFQNKPNRDY